MPTAVQARLDEKAEAALRRIARLEGWTTSRVIRECLLEGDQRRAQKSPPRLAGAGCVSFGPGDLATNKKHRKDFGRKSMGSGWVPPEEPGR